MTFKVSHFAAALGLSVMTATGASALTTIDATYAQGTALTPVTAGSGTGSVDVSFGWGDVSGTEYALGYVQFTTTDTVKLVMTGYDGPATGDEATAFMLHDAFGNELTAEYPYCTAGRIPAEIRGNCNLASNDPVTPFTAYVADGSTIVTAGPGTYYLGFYEGNDFSNGTLSFTVSAVPVPAGGLMLLGALGGLAVLRRRRKAV